ncbi:hypothetical protein BpHYR1_027495 [Brachionus plicatilis]|uniref:Uncharacterized protein n=1 Tax=Brachionus plicatilis TaxID=10195 RepID=A0A3M7RZ25_BRAPC|nr:hypothetical protein BpHYR1_027495 [Brachionus plicatilis]
MFHNQSILDLQAWICLSIESTFFFDIFAIEFYFEFGYRVTKYSIKFSNSLADMFLFFGLALPEGKKSIARRINFVLKSNNIGKLIPEINFKRNNGKLKFEIKIKRSKYKLEKNKFFQKHVMSIEK